MVTQGAAWACDAEQEGTGPLLTGVAADLCVELDLLVSTSGLISPSFLHLQQR
jgi:hypothetical protein